MVDSPIEGYVALPEGDRGPGVLVLHAWWGLTGFIRQLCDRLAAEGYVAAAPDLYHGATAATIEEADALRLKMDGEAAGDQAWAALDWLHDHSAGQGKRVAVLGFSLGAGFAVWLADRRRDQVAATVIFYGTSGGMPLHDGQPAYLGHFAANDPYEPAEEVRDLEERLRAAGSAVTFHIYPGTGHWFFEIDRPDAYDPQAAELAWQRTVEFLEKNLARG